VPTSKPRLALTLEQHVYDEVVAIAAAERRSVSNLVAGWVADEVERRASKKKRPAG
jgi:predicted DNA-binding ribbon-helix-helix protein